MAIIEKSISSNADGLKLGITIVTPAKNHKVKGIVQLVHGMSEHRKRYLPFMKFLAKKGYVSIINDHRGHGDSILNDADLGYFYDNHAEYIVEDVHQVTELIKADYPDKEVILFGHSMGSLVVRNYIQKYDDEISKLIVCGSPSNSHETLIGLLLVNILEKVKGPKYRSIFVHKLAFKNYSSHFKEKSINSWVSSSEDEVSKYDKDKKCGFIFTLNGFKNLFKLLRNTYKSNRYQMKNRDLAILFISGADDPVMIDEEHFYEACDFLKNLGYKVQHILYKDKRHDLLNEDIKDIVYQDIVEFIEEK